MTARPDRSEASGYYFTYIDQVPDGDVREQLDTQGGEFAGFLNGISEQKSLYRYAPDKWTIRDVVNHISDTERLFVFRAFWFARGFESPLPSFDQNIAVSSAKANDRTFRSLVDEFSAIRAGTIAFFRSLPDEAWSRRGIASDNPFGSGVGVYGCWPRDPSREDSPRAIPALVTA